MFWREVQGLLPGRQSPCRGTAGRDGGPVHSADGVIRLRARHLDRGVGFIARAVANSGKPRRRRRLEPQPVERNPQTARHRGKGGPLLRPGMDRVGDHGMAAGKGRFRLQSVHAGETAASIKENTGFEYDCPVEVPETAPPSAETLALIRGAVGADIAEIYPKFAREVLAAG